ncbi:hypothetical protein DCAR_0313612 [Daucus carota subsp. sativus]|uniref:Programmed cell death protein 4 n=1 Tax=Daucus carota subsp. sativus TaxID=79200 RepID=A0A166C4L2_DAUCS|nr:hypothetical protein DCAR_0313612 [Daucus carota subsp. sativus]
MKSTGKSSSNPKATGKSGHEARKDRQSGTGVTGSPKKGGHGGKFTWSGDNANLGNDEFIAAVDRNDPNFEDPDVAVAEN